MAELTDAWPIRTFAPIDSLASVTVHDAVLSRAENGFAYEANPPRYIRGAVYDRANRIVPSSQRRGGTHGDLVASMNPAMLSARERAEATQETLPGRWLYAGSWIHGFGHFLVETLPTLWPVLDGDQTYDGLAAHRFTDPRTFDWQFDLVALLTDLPVRIIDDVPVTVSEILVPERPYHYRIAISRRAADVWDRLSERAGGPAGSGIPIYLSRSQFDAERLARGARSGREHSNSEHVDQVFASRGFRVVYPEQLSAVEQVKVARSAPLVAGQAGSALHLSAFCVSGARVIELGDVRNPDQPVVTQSAISWAKQQPTGHIPYRPGPEGGIDLEHVKRSLDTLLAEID